MDPAPDISTRRDGPSGGIAILAATVAVALSFGIGVLWATHGGAVFYEIVTAGISACF